MPPIDSGAWRGGFRAGRSPGSRRARPATFTLATSSTPCTCGGSRARWAAGCCSGWRTTTGYAPGPSTSARCWTISTGSGSSPTSGRRAELRPGRSPYRQSDRGHDTSRRWRALAASRLRLRLRLQPPGHRRGGGRRRRPGDPLSRAVPGPGPGAGPGAVSGSGSKTGEERFVDVLLGRAVPASGGAVRRPAAARPARQLDLSVRGGGGRLAAGGGSRDPRRGPAREHRAPDPARPAAGRARRRRCSSIIRSCASPTEPSSASRAGTTAFAELRAAGVPAGRGAGPRRARSAGCLPSRGRFRRAGSPISSSAVGSPMRRLQPARPPQSARAPPSCTRQLAGTAAAQMLPRVIIQTDLGDIEVEVDSVHAPVTAANFLRYVDLGFYRVRPLPPHRHGRQPAGQQGQDRGDPGRARQPAGEGLPADRAGAHQGHRALAPGRDGLDGPRRPRHRHLGLLHLRRGPAGAGLRRQAQSGRAGLRRVRPGGARHGRGGDGSTSAPARRPAARSRRCDPQLSSGSG